MISVKISPSLLTNLSSYNDHISCHLQGYSKNLLSKEMEITRGQYCASPQSHGQTIHCGAIQILAVLAFVCFLFSVSVLGN